MKDLTHSEAVDLNSNSTLINEVPLFRSLVKIFIDIQICVYMCKCECMDEVIVVRVCWISDIARKIRFSEHHIP